MALERLFQDFDRAEEGTINYVEWTSTLTFDSLPYLVAQCKEEGPLYRATPTEAELKLYRAMRQRLHTLAQAAQDNGVRMMVDAEQSYFQPAIDSMVLELQKEYNQKQAVVWNTYQMYSTDSLDRLRDDLHRSKLLGYRFGAKLVRGAYMESERARAYEHGYESPIHGSLEDTHRSYDRGVETVLEDIAAGSGARLMVASHNERSVQRAIDGMARLGIAPTEVGGGGVAFGQLLGMADEISFTLGRHGYSVYKYVPYGEIEEVVPYLVRRAQENSAIAGSAQVQAAAVAAVLRQRLLGW